jgi:hypothetical protein
MGEVHHVLGEDEEGLTAPGPTHRRQRRVGLTGHRSFEGCVGTGSHLPHVVGRTEYAVLPLLREWTRSEGGRDEPRHPGNRQSAVRSRYPRSWTLPDCEHPETRDEPRRQEQERNRGPTAGWSVT